MALTPAFILAIEQTAPSFDSVLDFTRHRHHIPDNELPSLDQLRDAFDELCELRKHEIRQGEYFGKSHIQRALDEQLDGGDNAQLRLALNALLQLNEEGRARRTRAQDGIHAAHLRVVWSAIYARFEQDIADAVEREEELYRQNVCRTWWMCADEEVGGFVNLWVDQEDESDGDGDDGNSSATLGNSDSETESDTSESE